MKQKITLQITITHEDTNYHIIKQVEQRVKDIPRVEKVDIQTTSLALK
jgi:translation elongation factor EF-1beta